MIVSPFSGKSGRSLTVRSNFLALEDYTSDIVYQYDVQVLPELPPAILRSAFCLFQEFYADKKEFGGIRPVFDGRRNVFTSRPLPFGDMATFDIPDLEAAIVGRQGKESALKITLKLAAKIPMENLDQFFKGEIQQSVTCFSSFSLPREAITPLEIALIHSAASRKEFVTVSRNFFTQAGAKSLGMAAEVWPGYHQSIRHTKDGLKLNVDITATAFFEAGPLITLVANILGFERESELNKPIGQRDIHLLQRTLVGLKVVVTHRGDMKRKFRIIHIGESAIKSTFDCEGKQTTIADYFASRYNKHLKFPDLPIIHVGNIKNPQFLPMEVCDVPPGQRYVRALQERQQAAMIRYANKKPNERASMIAQGVTIMNYAEDPYLKEFNMKINPQLESVQARRLDPPKILFHEKSRVASLIPQQGSWDLRDKMFKNGTVIRSWGVIVFATERDAPRSMIQQFVTAFMGEGQKVNVRFEQNRPEIGFFNPNNVIRALKSIGNPEMQFLLCILPNTGAPLYNEIKRVSETELGIVTQCIQLRHARNPKPQYCGNVLLKVNVKCGGVNSVVDRGSLPVIPEAPTIVIGADITHPLPFARKANSVATLVGSLDVNAARYTAAISTEPTEEMKNNRAVLAKLVAHLLRAFYKSNKGLAPQRIIFYRDGVSEGEFGQVMANELNSIRLACHNIDAEYSPKITYIVVQKRHHTRFFPISPNDADKSGNLPPGVVVDTQVTSSNHNDFYLLSHAGLQGTSRPAHYYTLYDDNQLTPDQIQIMTNALTYNYARATKSVSIVTPVYYANLVNLRVTTAGEREYNVIQRLNQVMWFM